MFDDSQPETRATLLAGTARINTVKTLGQPRQMLAADADTGIAHFEMTTVRVHSPLHGNGTALRRVLDRVADEVGDDGVHLAGSTQNT